MVAFPAEGRLDHVVQRLKRHGERHLNLPPDGRLDAFQRNSQPGDVLGRDRLGHNTRPQRRFLKGIRRWMML